MVQSVRPTAALQTITQQQPPQTATEIAGYTQMIVVHCMNLAESWSSLFIIITGRKYV